MSQPKISIVVPVYKTEQYLRKCLESLVHQTITDLEIVVVNDGSPDNAHVIIDEFAGRYPGLVKGYRKPNGGLGDACNYGVERAHGDYIGFLSSDDYARPNVFEKMVQRADAEQADIVICEFYFVNETGTIIGETAITGHTDLNITDRRYALKYGRTEAFNKIYRRRLFERTGIRYPPGWFEDFPTTPLLIEAAKKISYIPEPLIYYVQRNDSIMGEAKQVFSDRNFAILAGTESIIRNRDRFDPADYAFFMNEIAPIYVFLKCYLQIVTIPDARSRNRVVRDWGRRLNELMPGWEKSKAISDRYHYINSRIKKIAFKMVIHSFKTGNPFWINLLAQFLHFVQPAL